MLNTGAKANITPMSYAPSSSSTRQEAVAVASVGGGLYGLEDRDRLAAAKSKTTQALHGAGTQKRHDWKVMYSALVQFGIEKGHCNGT